MRGRVYIRTFGCQMNEKDSERMMGLLADAGYGIAADPSAADVVLVNTCSVREKPEQKVFGVLGRLKAEKAARPLVIGVGGCVAQQLGEKLLDRVPYLDLVFGVQTIHMLPELIERARSGERIAAIEWLESGDANLFQVPEHYTGHSVTGFISIMQGCDNHCAYCIVPAVRGPAVARRPEAILAEIAALTKRGLREVTLLGQNVNAYREDGTDFPKLLAAVGDAPGLARVRFTTSHPKDLDPGLIEIMAAHPRIMEHIHLPVQAGSDRVLRLMDRGYTRDQYLGLVKDLRAAMPGIGITTDLIVGFPGETEADFLDTLSLLTEVRYDETFSFRYSIRPGTAAAEFPDQVPEPEKYDRLYRLQELQAQITETKNQAQVGARHEVLIEGPSKTDPERVSGRTRTNRLVHLPKSCGRPGELATIYITRALKHSLIGDTTAEPSAGAHPSEEETCLWR